MPRLTESSDKYILEPALSMSAQVAEQICQRIHNEKLVPGTYLGTVEKLTEQIGRAHV